MNFFHNNLISTLLQYYSIICFIVGGGLLSVWYGRAYICSAATGFTRTIGTDGQMVKLVETNIQYSYALRIGTAPIGF